MRLLLDENVPAPLSSTLKTLLRQVHEVVHVVDLDWSGTKDVPLFERAAAEAFQVVLTNDGAQMEQRHEVEAIARSRLHRVAYRQRHKGLIGMGLAVATVCAGLPSVLEDLEGMDGQRLVTLRSVEPERSRRYVVRDPSVNPPKFWPDSA